MRARAASDELEPPADPPAAQVLPTTRAPTRATATASDDVGDRQLAVEGAVAEEDHAGDAERGELEGAEHGEGERARAHVGPTVERRP